MDNQRQITRPEKGETSNYRTVSQSLNLENFKNQSWRDIPDKVQKNNFFQMDGKGSRPQPHHLINEQSSNYRDLLKFDKKNNYAPRAAKNLRPVSKVMLNSIDFGGDTNRQILSPQSRLNSRMFSPTNAGLNAASTLDRSSKVIMPRLESSVSSPKE
jgi:hypothetical protein